MRSRLTPHVGMNENRHLQIFGALKEWQKLWIVEIATFDV
jgi:hypothetical protein